MTLDHIMSLVIAVAYFYVVYQVLRWKSKKEEQDAFIIQKLEELIIAFNGSTKLADENAKVIEECMNAMVQQYPTAFLPAVDLTKT